MQPSPRTAPRLSRPLLCVLPWILAGCVPDDVVNAAVDATTVLRNAMNDLRSESGNWQSTLGETVRELQEGGQSTLANEVNNLLQRGVATTGVEFRCNADFVQKRITAGVEAILARLEKRPPLPTPPHLCHTVPGDINLNLGAERRVKIDCFGFDLDHRDARRRGMELRLIRSGRAMPVPGRLSVQTHYKAVINLANLPLVGVSHLALYWGGREFSRIPVLGKVRKEPTSFTFLPSVLDFTPPHVPPGDRDFKGNGPLVRLQAQARLHGNEVQVRVFMSAHEAKNGRVKRGHTRAQGWSPWRTAYRAKAGERILRITSKTASSGGYLDHNHTVDTVSLPAGELVSRFECTGDAKGDDAGVRTKVRAVFNRITIERQLR